jgi:hypothetical protein
METIGYYFPLEEKFIARHKAGKKNEPDEPGAECELAAKQLLCDRPVREATRELVQALERMDERFRRLALAVDDIRERHKGKEREGGCWGSSEVVYPCNDLSRARGMA